MSTDSLPSPYLLFLADLTEPAFGKTAFGLRDWVPGLCLGECSLPTATVSTGLPKLTPAQARERGARSLVIGVAPRGGIVAASWISTLLSAMDAGLHLISGMHMRLEEVPELKSAAERLGRRLINVRQPPAGLPIATGLRRSGKRLLTVGTDCSLGKKYTALALTRAFRQRGLSADFRATGQTGILIAGSGIPMDGVVAGLLSGAAEVLSPQAADDHWDVVEGQGSLFHPSFAGVSLGLMHGTQPDVLVMCHEPGRQRMVGVDYPPPSIEEAIPLHLQLARRMNPNVRCAGVSLNTAQLSEKQAHMLLEREQARLNMPVADPIRGGATFGRLVDSCLRA
jgi:uncharacterized NAD-dependent epimerase/dehydratase family protein